jgi:beta-glucosidase
MKSVCLFFLLSLSALFCTAQKSIDEQVAALLKKMTLDEKIGQMNQYSSDFAATGPITKQGDKQEQIRKGMIGSFLNVTGAERTRTLQEMALQSRLKIPLLFGQDVIHGYRTIFPIPLAEAASWDMEAIQRSARIAATEVSAAGVHWTFAPMVDIARDPRWGRVMEGAGEDPYLGSLIAKARVQGFQGNGIGNTDAVMACAKHFAAYGAAIGGRDYNAVDISLPTLYNIYLPPFKAAADAGAATFMNSFNDLNGIPATGNKFLQRDILKKEWGFKGFVVSDWGSVGEMINHGYSKDLEEAAAQAANAGSDMDMESRAYTQHLAKLVKTGKVKMSVVDEAVKRILLKKFELGLFNDPFKYCSEEREKQQWNNPVHLDAAHDMAKKSIVLLKNNGALLPISKTVKTIALIGPFVKAIPDNLGFWSYQWPDDSTRVVTLYDGVKNKLGNNTQLLYAKGCNMDDSDSSGFVAAVEAARKADVVILSVGEAGNVSGEAKSRSSIGFQGVQEQLVKAVYATGKPIVVFINAGRPLVFNWTKDNAQAILYSWWLGTKAGDAQADVLFGDYNPSAKLPMSFPRIEGQIPIYYNHYNTGRPAANDSDVNYVSAYIDLPNSPAYPFGYGLSYASFQYGKLTLSKTNAKGNETITASVPVTNTGSKDGEEVIQLYIRDVTGSIVRPVKELKGFQKLMFRAGETKTVQFRISTNDLKFYTQENAQSSTMKYDWEPGEFIIMVGGNSHDVQSAKMNWEK